MATDLVGQAEMRLSRNINQSPPPPPSPPPQSPPPLLPQSLLESPELPENHAVPPSDVLRPRATRRP